MPKELDSVVTQLKNAFAFKNYRLMDVLTLRARTGQRAQTTSAGAMVEMGTSGHQPATTVFHLNSVSVATDGTTIHLEGMSTEIRMPLSTGGNSFQMQTLGLNSDVDIKEGQKVVVGRVGVSNGQALFLVLVARVVS